MKRKGAKKTETTKTMASPPDREPSPARSGGERGTAIKASPDSTQVRSCCEPGTARGPGSLGGILNAWWVHALIVLGLLLGNLALYHGTFGLGFLSVDDPDYVQNNPYIESFSAANLKHLLTAPYSANYAPANILSYALDVALAGRKSAFAIHLSNVLWHGWVVCMVYVLALRVVGKGAESLFPLTPALSLGERENHPPRCDEPRPGGISGDGMRRALSPRERAGVRGNSTLHCIDTGKGRGAEDGTQGKTQMLIAAAASALFLLHPAHVEVVAWVSSRKDLVATGSAALAMTCYLLYRGRSWWWVWWYAGSLLAFLLASAGKQSVLLLPAVMLVWDILVEKRRSWQMLADKVPFGLITLFFGWMTWHAQPSTNQGLHFFVLAATELANLWLLTGLGQYTLYHTAPDPAAWSHAARLGVIGLAVLVWALPLLFVRARQSIHASLCYWVLIQMVPPMVLGFIVPITDRYLFLPSVGVCILLADLLIQLPGRMPRGRWIGCGLLVFLGAVWGVKTWNYVNEWRDPRSVWYGAHLKTRNSQVFQFLGEVYQNAGDRMHRFVIAGEPLQATNEVPLAQAVLGDAARVERLRAEWAGAAPARTNSMAYRNQLWDLAWEQFEVSLARRGTLSAPNLFMCRGRLLVSEGKFAQAISEFQKALALAQTSSYDVTRAEGSTHALFAIGVACWNMGNYREAQQWLLKAQAVQKKSGQPWLPALDREVERINALVAGQK